MENQCKGHTNKKYNKNAKYQCTNCGIINETEGTAPKNCMKCDNEKFIKL